MEEIFDQDVIEIGAEIDAYCTKCRGDSPHTVISKYEDEVRSVQCNICSSVHAFRPHGMETEFSISQDTLTRSVRSHRGRWVDRSMVTGPV